jgi:hypothetical protein
MKPVLIKKLGKVYLNSKAKNTSYCGIFKCQECGEEFKATLGSIQSGDKKNCGCLKKEKRLSKTKRIKSTQYIGVTKVKTKYIAQVVVDSKTLRLGHFKTAEEAAAQYNEYVILFKLNKKINENIKRTPLVPKNKPISKTGYFGVSFDSHQVNKQYKTRIGINGKTKLIGCFATAKEAALAYNKFILLNNLPNRLNKVL